MLVLLLFFASGATALVYEVLWSKYLSLMLGSTVQAQTVVLAVFMGGLALGNRLFGKRSETVGSPLIAYGVLEILIGLYAFAFPLVYHAFDSVFIGIGSRVYNSGVLLLLLKLLISVALLLLPTILMGGTLPLIAAWIQKQPGFESGARVGIFYAVNSLGAVFGAGLAGFFLIQTYGMVLTLQLTAVANFMIGLAAWLLAKRAQSDISQPVVPRQSKAPAIPQTSALSPAPASSTWFAMLVALTGGVSMGLEVLSARALALIAGGSLQAFALVLMSFILGIGLGSIVISSSKAARGQGIQTIYLLLLLAGTAVIINVVFIEEWLIVYSQARFGLAANNSGYLWHQISLALMSFLMLGIPAACLGAVVPLCIRLLQDQNQALGDQVGRLLTANTIGAVIGVLVTGFILMPVIGLRAALATLAIVLMGVTAYIAFKRQNSTAAMVALALIAISVTAVGSTGENWRTVMSSGVFRLRNTFVTKAWLDTRKKESQILFYKDSADATVAVERAPHAVGGAAQISLRINGKTDASTMGDLATQYLLAHLPMMAKQDAKQVFVLGFGSGITGGAILGHPIEKLTIAENCGPVLEAGHIFDKWNRGVLTNARTIVRNDDARTVLKLSPQKYDVIISEPSNPWVAGVGSVFSQEFYQLCASRLSEGGIVAQWFHSYEMSDYITFLVLRTFASVFPHIEVWDSQEGDIILLGSNKAWESSPAHYQKIFERAEVRKDLTELKITTGVALWARQIASQKTGPAIAGDGPIQSDEFPILEYAAPQSFFRSDTATKLYFYDERTIQFPLADKVKIAVLRAIPERPLLESFQYSSSNPDVRLYLNAVLSSIKGGSTKLDPMAQIIFKQAELYPEHPAISSNATPEFAECLKLEARMLRAMDNWKEPARRIEEILTGLVEKGNLKPRDFSAGYYAALIARFAMGDGDSATALRLLRLGMIFNSQDEQILYLTRVLDRIVPPELLEEYRKKAALKNINLLER